MLESKYQADLIKDIKKTFEGSIVFVNDSWIQQGIPDLLVLFRGGGWAMLEVKISETAVRQPNQEYWVNYYDELSYAAFIYPQNQEAVFDDLQQAFGARRPARLSFRQ